MSKLKTRRQKNKSEKNCDENKKKTHMKRIPKSKKTAKKFFRHLIRELFLLLEVKKARLHSLRHYSLSVADPWYQDVKKLKFLFKKFKLFFTKKHVRHPVLDLVVVAMVITYYQRYFDRIVCRAAREILLRSRSKLSLCSKEDFSSFYSSIRDDIEDILRAKGEF